RAALSLFRARLRQAGDPASDPDGIRRLGRYEGINSSSPRMAKPLAGDWGLRQASRTCASGFARVAHRWGHERLIALRFSRVALLHALFGAGHVMVIALGRFAFP